MSGNHSTRSGGIIRIYFSIFFNTKVCCVFSLESPHQCDSSEYTQYTIFNMKKEWSGGAMVLGKLQWPGSQRAVKLKTTNQINMKKKITLNYPISAAMGFFPRDSRTSSKQLS